MVRKIANQVYRTIPKDCIEIDDLIAMGTLGLYEAAERYDPKSGNRFSTFSWYRVRGAILDGLRSNSVVHRKNSRVLRAEEGASEYLSQAFPGGTTPTSTGEAMGALGGALKSLATIYVFSMDTTESILADETRTPEEESTYSQMIPRLRENLHVLDETERRIIEGVYCEDKTLKDLSEELGRSRSWGCRIHARAIEKLRDKLL
ncbi:sigma-70 family RNA polymerase sigma factor [Myxococcota bacterium]|nr:sigma-70 family RNA polymerase sigma factor [Myxococcota bacterium]